MLALLQLLCFVLCARASEDSPIPPEYSEMITVYHVNPIIFGIAPVNMDTGDALGDMYFDLRSVSLPIECAHPTNATAKDCDNEEVIANDLVINQLVLEVDNRQYGEYGRCNICVNGSDHHGNNNCTDGLYICSCGEFNAPKPCGSWVGKTNLTDMYAGRSCSSSAPNYDCWKDHVVNRTGGFWYSTTESGWCDRKGFNPATDKCSWRVAHAVKRINKTCSDDMIYSAVEKHDKTDCFSKCAAGAGPKRNVSDPCWIECFYDAALGPGSALSTWDDTDGGIPRSALEQIWKQPFASEQDGGCPSLPFD